MAFALALALLVLTGVTTLLFTARWWWLPVLASQHGAAIDAQISRTFWLTGIIFVVAQLGLAWAILRYRARGQRAAYIKGSLRAEIAWTTATAVLFIGLALLGQSVWAERMLTYAGPQAVQVEITGQQFAWNVRYAGPDGKFGRTDVRFVDDSTGNPLGLDPADPAGRDDVVVPTMAIPVGRPVELTLRTKDVTHSFFVRELRVKQDAVPGLNIRIHFTATREGRYEIACAELCGLGHHRMRSFLDVLPEAEFQKWLQERAPR